jgi:hypothetical protein
VLHNQYFVTILILALSILAAMPLTLELATTIPRLVITAIFALLNNATLPPETVIHCQRIVMMETTVLPILAQLSVESPLAPTQSFLAL